MPHFLEYTASFLFAVAILHTFSVPIFARLARQGGAHSGMWHLLSEVEAVFGVWAFVLIICMTLLSGSQAAIQYMNTRHFTEALFVFAIMVIAASRPILELIHLGVKGLARILPLRRECSNFLIILSVIPLIGSFITEPAAMTLAALLLRDAYFRHSRQVMFKYLVLGVLFVNISIGGVLTSYAAPPVLMVASTFKWDTVYMLTHFGWRAIVAVCINACVLTFICRKDLAACAIISEQKTTKQKISSDHGQARPSECRVPILVMAVHLAFLVAVVLMAAHPAIFLGLLMLFVGYTEAYKRYQDRLMIKEALMVGFFLGGLVVLGGLQKWWLQDFLGQLAPNVLFWGATVLTAITDNAALTYLGSLVENSLPAWRYMLVAGAVTGGGLTVIANAPNPAGFAILKNAFPNNSISPGPLFLAALVPTLFAALMFLIPG